MPVQVLMPALSPTMTEGKLTKWNVKVGDTIKSGQVLAEIETDKATMEVEAVEEGVLSSILVPEGSENVAVNTPIATIVEEGEDAAAPPPAAAPKAAVQSAAAKPAPAAPSAAASGAPAPATATPKAAAPGERIFVSPLAKRIAEQAGLDLRGIEGSGPHGRIVKHDVEQALKSGARPPQAAPAAAAAAAPPSPAPAAAAAPIAVPAGDYIEVPLTSMRKTIARRLTEAKQQIPHIYLTIDVELDALLALRSQLNAKSDAYKLSVNDFVVRACGLALRKVPEANAIWAGDKILQSKNFDVSVAVALDQGLITPIVRNADQKGLAQISSEMKDLAGRAKAGKLKLEEFQGGAFSLSNLGMFGIKDFCAVINPPQAAILAVGAGEQRPVVKQNALSIATMMSCTLSCDHRIVDGALGAKWLAAFKSLIEDPLTMLL